MGWALIIMFCFLQAVAFAGVRALDRRFGINERFPGSGSRTSGAFMVWYVCGFFNFFIAFIAAALWFD